MGKIKRALAIGLVSTALLTPSLFAKDTLEKKIEYDIQGNYGFGWETVTCEETLAEAKKRLAEYNENEPKYAHRIKRSRN